MVYRDSVDPISTAQSGFAIRVGGFSGITNPLRAQNLDLLRLLQLLKTGLEYGDSLLTLSIDRDGRAGDCPRCVRGEKEKDVCNSLWLDPSVRLGVRHILSVLRRIDRSR